MTGFVDRRRAGAWLNATFAVLLVMGLGATVRIFQIAYADFPPGDGGMFYRMIEDLVRGGFRLPAVTSYNGGAIPFAYPPLLFYVVGFFHQITGASILELFRWLSLLVSVLLIPAVYILARTLLEVPRQALFAAFFMALCPTAFILGGGALVRGGGLLLGVLTVWQGALLYRSGKARYAVTTGILLALTVLSHPQMGYTTAYSLLLLFLFSRKTRTDLGNSILVVVLALLVTAPWWLTVIGYHTLAPFMSAFFGVGSLQVRVANLFFLPFGLGGQEPTFWGFLGLLGMVKLVADRRWLLPLWIAAMFFLDVRIPIGYMLVPLSLMAGTFIDEVLLPMAVGGRAGTQSRAGIQFAGIGLLILVTIGGGIVLALNAGSSRLDGDTRAAMRWITDNTPTEARFAVLTGPGTLWYADLVSEWFPQRTGRVSLTTVQGHEWLSDLPRAIGRYEKLQACGTQPITCVEAWLEETAVPSTEHDYLYIAYRAFNSYALLESVRASRNYERVYENSHAVIFRKH